jgi:hypothetical protein
MVATPRKRTKLEITKKNTIINDPGTSATSRDSESMSFAEEFQEETHDENIVTENDDQNDGGSKVLMYGLDEIHELTAKVFEEAETSDEPVKFTYEIELDQDLLVAVSLDQLNLMDDCNLKVTETRFRQLANTFIVPFESGSGYYWELRKIYLNTKKKTFTGSVTVYLGCTMRDDRTSQRSDSQPPKRKSEARMPIERYKCAGNIKLTIVPEQRYALVQGYHHLAHDKPTYRQIEFPANAKECIKENFSLSLGSTEMHRRLSENRLINPEIHTIEQVYYWTSVYRKNTYVMNQENQLLSAKLYLERPEFREKGFKVLNYLENDFVRALGFLTPLFKRIGAENTSEIVVDSTFKTNQERFELFVVNLNCRGYGMPIAYLYLATLGGTEEARNSPKNNIKTRVEVLQIFFANLRLEGLQPVFALVDKDAGEISSICEAWSWTVNVQICCWHLEQAIDRKIKDKKSKTNTYSAIRASEAHNKFNFIDPSWVQGSTRSFCPDNSINQLFDMVKKHASMHPLIPVGKNSYMTSDEIHQFCVQEVYQFCHSRSLVGLWGYLWANWYNEKDWKLFALSSYPYAIPLARTTMITESHWRVLKYNYKYNYNRPRVDRLTQIITEQLVPDFEIKLTHYNGNRAFPAWWHKFKAEWRKAAAAETRPDAEEQYHIDVNNWVCSCPGYLRSNYNLCKHLISKKNGKQFLPTFLETARRHDYPLLAFGNNRMPVITSINNPWTRFGMAATLNNPIEVNSSPNTSNLRETLAKTNYDIMEEKQEKYAQYKKKFEAALRLYEREMDNNHFTDKFDALVGPFLKKIDECESVLRANKQQATWKPKGKLAMWLR